MADLIYGALASLDGYIENEHGSFDWAEPDEEVHSLFNDLERSVGTHLYGRRLYETMAVWETLPLDDPPDHILSTQSSGAPPTTSCTLAAQAFRSGLVDELHVVLAPIVVGGGKRCLPDDVRVPLELVGERRFGNGFVHLHYRT